MPNSNLITLLKARKVHEFNSQRLMAQFEQVELRGLFLELTALTTCNFHNIAFFEATLRGTRFDSSDFSCTRLHGADLSMSSFQNCKFAGADLRGANLKKADLTDADLTDADLGCGTDLREAIGLTPIQLAKARNLEYAMMEPGRFSDACAAGYELTKPEPIRVPGARPRKK